MSRVLGSVSIVAFAFAALGLLSVRAYGQKSDFRQGGNRKEQLASDPDVLRIANSASICAYQSLIDTANENLREAKHASRIAGVANLRELRELQTDIHAYRKSIASIRKGFKQHRLKPMACAATVARVSACLLEKNQGANPLCADPKIRDYLAVAPEVTP